MILDKRILTGFIMTLSLLTGSAHASDCDACAGMHHEYTIKDAPTEIISENIVSFKLYLFEPQRYGMTIESDEYSDKEILASQMTLKKNPDGTLNITARGGNMYSTRRDGSAFIVDFNTKDNGYTAELNKIIQKYNIARRNGHISHTDGLPSGDGDTLDVTYESAERIYINANNYRILNFYEAYDIYALFKKITRDNGLDFNTAGSNVQLYDDPTIEWLQGSWKGKHFGRDVLAVFKENHIQIFYNGELTDDTDFVIVDGTVKPAGKGAENGEYAEFKAVTGFNKKNSFSLSGHVYKNRSSSTFELLKQK
jgi:hypothetical protein